MSYQLEYNSERENLIIPEYGRNIQKLVNHCVSLPTKEERNVMAKAIIDVMGNLQPHLRDVPDFKHKLWDQIHIMSNFKLDVDTPYETPEKEILEQKPTPLSYPKLASKYRFYGTNIETMIDVALTWEKGELKDALVFTIANHMKKCYLNWNKDTVEDSIIFNHLFELSDGAIDLRNSDQELSDTKNLLKKRNTQQGRTNQQSRNTKGRTNHHHKNRKK